MVVIVTAKVQTKVKKLNKEKLKLYWSVIYPDNYVKNLVAKRLSNGR